MKKIISLVLVLVLALTAIGGTLAYFTDNDKATNTFTLGNVAIDLKEVFEQNSILNPGVAVEKKATVTNTGKNDAFVRVHLGIPAALVDQQINAYNDMVHWNFSGEDYKAGKWSMRPQYDEANGWTSNGLANNFTYNTEINGEEYTVWVITYRTALKANETTGNVLTQVYMDHYTDTILDQDGKVVKYVKPFFTDKQGGVVSETEDSFEWPANKDIKVELFAEGVQAEGFENAYAAFDAAFGKPTATNNPWTYNK